MSKLAGDDFEKLLRLLCDALTPGDLEKLLRFKMKPEIALEEEVAFKGQLKRDIFFALLEWLEARNRTGEFLAAIRIERAGVPEIANFCDRYAAPPGTAPVASAVDAGAPSARIVEFRTLFGQRKIQFDYLNAYKALHDVLHKLQEQRVAIAQAVQRFKAVPDDALELSIIADKIDDELVSNAKSALPRTEFPDDFAKWVGTFDESVQSLRGSLQPANPPAAERAVEILGTLSNQQAGLNAELVRCAKRLRTNELIDKMQAILAGLGAAARVDALRDGLTRFRGLCQQLAALTLDHDACQDVETSLAAVGREAIAPTGVYDWPKVLASLLRIAGRRPDDKMAERLAKYAKGFDAAPDAKSGTPAFALLREQFGRLFYKTDENLLDVTDALVSEADRLDALLGGLP